MSMTTIAGRDLALALVYFVTTGLLVKLSLSLLPLPSSFIVTLALLAGTGAGYFMAQLERKLRDVHFESRDIPAVLAFGIAFTVLAGWPGASLSSPELWKTPFFISGIVTLVIIIGVRSAKGT